MHVLQQQFQVPFSYQVIFTKHLFDSGNKTLCDYISNFGQSNFRKRILFVIDKGVADANPSLTSSIISYFEANQVADLAPELLVLPGGEVCKNDPRFYEEVVRAIDEHRIDRHSFVASIGGGAFLDMSGYAAAISHRGVKLIRIPTTVLSQNDSGVGVKNGVNYLGKKNFLGTFAPAVAVFNDVSFLATLEDRDWRSGIAEAIKVALIKDLAFFEWLESNVAAMNARDEDVMTEQIYRCADLHMKHISGGDPFELGSARPLDFGHWAAHKLEQLSEYRLRHGEAVAIGIGLFGVAASFSAQVLARRKEFGLLVHLGLTRAQVLRLLALEGLAWTTLGALAGTALGLAVAAVLVFVVNPQSFHWSMDLSVPWLRLLALGLAVMAAGTATAWVSGRSAAGRDAVMAVKEDW